MDHLIVGEELLERMVRAVQMVRERLRRAVAAFESGGIPYAVVGGNAVAAWVATVDESAVRNTPDVDLLVRRADLDAARTALQAAGFVERHSSGGPVFLDGPQARDRDAVHLVFAGERVRPDDAATAPDVAETLDFGGFRVPPLAALVGMKLTSFRRKDQVHLSDLIDVGLIDASWPSRFPHELGERLQHLLDTPEG